MPCTSLLLPLLRPWTVFRRRGLMAVSGALQCFLAESFPLAGGLLSASPVEVFSVELSRRGWRFPVPPLCGYLHHLGWQSRGPRILHQRHCHRRLCPHSLESCCLSLAVQGPTRVRPSRVCGHPVPSSSSGLGQSLSFSWSTLTWAVLRTTSKMSSGACLVFSS